MRKGLPLNGGRPFAFGTGKTRRGYPSPGFFRFDCVEIQLLDLSEHLLERSRCADGKPWAIPISSRCSRCCCIAGQRRIGLSIRLFTGTAAGLRGRKDDYGAFVLLAPDTGDPIPVEVMRMVSAQLIEEPELIERLRTGQRDAAVQLLEEKLDRLFSEHGN